MNEVKCNCGHIIKVKEDKTYECPACFMKYYVKNDKRISEIYTLNFQNMIKNKIEDKFINKPKNILCLLGLHKYVSFVVAPYVCLPEMCERCGEKKDKTK
jgi:hypothetical protein